MDKAYESNSNLPPVHSPFFSWIVFLTRIVLAHSSFIIVFHILYFLSSSLLSSLANILNSGWVIFPCSPLSVCSVFPNPLFWSLFHYFIKGLLNPIHKYSYQVWRPLPKCKGEELGPFNEITHVCVYLHVCVWIHVLDFVVKRISLVMVQQFERHCRTDFDQVKFY